MTELWDLHADWPRITYAPGTLMMATPKVKLLLSKDRIVVYDYWRREWRYDELSPIGEGVILKSRVKEWLTKTPTTLAMLKVAFIVKNESRLQC